MINWLNWFKRIIDLFGWKAFFAVMGNNNYLAKLADVINWGLLGQNG